MSKSEFDDKLQPSKLEDIAEALKRRLLLRPLFLLLDIVLEGQHSHEIAIKMATILSSVLPKPKGKNVVESVPGFGFRDFLGHFCSKKFREQVLEALHADAVADYLDAIANGNATRAKIIYWMIYVWLIQAVLGGVLSWVVGKLSFKIGSSRD